MWLGWTWDERQHGLGFGLRMALFAVLFVVLGTSAPAPSMSAADGGGTLQVEVVDGVSVPQVQYGCEYHHLR